MRKITLAAVLLALIAVSCKAEINVGLDLNADGSGTVVAEFGFDEEFQELAFEGADPASDIFSDNDLADVPGATVDEYTRGEFTFYRVQVPFQEISEIEQQAGGDSPFDELSITTTDDEVRVTASLGAADQTLIDPESLEGADQFGADVFEEVFDFNVRIAMPGKVLSHNADSVESDGTLVWDIPFTGDELSIEAVSDPTGSSGGGGFPALLIGLIVIVVVGAIAFFVLRRRGSTSAVTDPPPPAADPGTTFVGDTPLGEGAEPGPDQPVDPT